VYLLRRGKGEREVVSLTVPSKVDKVLGVCDARELRKEPG